MKKLFIFGIGSLTGSKLALLAKNDFQVFGSYNLRNPDIDIEKIKLDILNYNKVKEVLTNKHPDIVVNACAINNVDYCENHKEEVKQINVDFVENLADVSNLINAKLIHLSSDSVFDGIKKEPYTEDDLPNPINYYGYTKLSGERPVLKYSKNIVVRISVLYGWLLKSLQNIPSSSMKPENFGLWLINKLQSNEKVRIITDEYSSPIIADDFANSILHLIKGNYSGIFHAAPNIKISRYDFSVKLTKALGLDINLIFPVKSEELGRSVTTGFNKCLDASKMENKTGFKFLSLEESFQLLKKQVYES